MPTINGLRRGSGNPTLSTLHQLANFFDVSIGDLTEKNMSVVKESTRLVYEIPLLVMDQVPDFLNNQNKYKDTVSTELDSWKANKYYGIKIINNAMQPLFERGSIFVIAKDMHVHDGDIVLVQFDKHPPCFRKVILKENHTFLNLFLS